MTEIYDIISEDGTRVVRCENTDGFVTIHSKETSISFQSFVAQAMNPALAKQKKARLRKKNKERGVAKMHP